jgi:5-methylcytosine-specific restriction enzyme subunit McrC
MITALASRCLPQDPLVRGRIRLADQFARRPGVFVPLEVRYDEDAAGIVENQIIRSALRRMTAVPGLDPAARARLGHLDARLDGVRILAHGEPTPTWRVTGLNARYPPAIRLAEIVLRNQSAEPGPGGHTIAGQNSGASSGEDVPGLVEVG